MTGRPTKSPCSTNMALRNKVRDFGNVKGSVPGLTPGIVSESSHRDEQHGAPPFSGRAIASLSAFIAANRRSGEAALSRAVARSPANRQIGHEHTWCPSTIIPWQWHWCSAARARGATPTAPESVRIRSAAVARLSGSAVKPLSTSVR